MKLAGAAGVLGFTLATIGSAVIGAFDNASILDFPGTRSSSAEIYRGGYGQNARLLYDLTFGMLAMSGVPTAVALASYCALVWRSGRLPRWTAVLAAIAATAHVVLLASFLVGDGFFSLQGQVISAIPATLFVWILGTAVAMLAASTRAS
jgi:hypothetical protein